MVKSAALIPEILRRCERRKYRGGTYVNDDVPYWPASAVMARKLLQEEFEGAQRLPRPGHEVEFPETEYKRRKGKWILSNHGGQYELAFYEGE